MDAFNCCGSNPNASKKNKHNRAISTSTFSDMPMNLVIEIISYLDIRDYRDIAKLRLLSKSVHDAIPYVTRTMSPVDCSYGGTSSDFFKSLFGQMINNEDAKTAGIYVKFEGDDNETRREISMFDGFELEDVTVFFSEYDEYDDLKSISNIKIDTEYTSPSQDRYDEFSRLCQDIVATCTKSFVTSQSIARDAAIKGMFLPVSNNMECLSSSKVKAETYESEEYYIISLVIATLSIPIKDFSKSSFHKKDGDKIYLQMSCAMEEEEETDDEEEENVKSEDKEDQNDQDKAQILKPYLSYDALLEPRKQDEAQMFRAYPINNLCEGMMTVKVPMVIKEEAEVLTHENEDCQFLPVNLILSNHAFQSA